MCGRPAEIQDVIWWDDEDEIREPIWRLKPSSLSVCTSNSRVGGLREKSKQRTDVRQGDNMFN
jgi:hypothetical protein